MFVSFDFRVMVALKKFVYSFKFDSQLEQGYNNSNVRWITTILVNQLQSKTVVQIMHAVGGEGKEPALQEN